MARRLTLTLEPELIESARRYARRQGKSVSRLFADYVTALDPALTEAPEPVRAEDWPEPMRSLVGLLSGHDATIEDYRNHLLERHG